jgi:hypothetical protein
MTKQKEKFLHHLRDTIILLGVEVELANLMVAPNDIAELDIDRLRQFNIMLIEATKNKLANINKMKIVLGDR